MLRYVLTQYYTSSHFNYLFRYFIRRSVSLCVDLTRTTLPHVGSHRIHVELRSRMSKLATWGVVFLSIRHFFIFPSDSSSSISAKMISCILAVGWLWISVSQLNQDSHAPVWSWCEDPRVRCEKHSGCEKRNHLLSLWVRRHVFPALYLLMCINKTQRSFSCKWSSPILLDEFLFASHVYLHPPWFHCVIVETLQYKTRTIHNPSACTRVLWPRHWRDCWTSVDVAEPKTGNTFAPQAVNLTLCGLSYAQMNIRGSPSLWKFRPHCLATTFAVWPWA